MQLTEGYRLTALRNAQQFLAEHADDLPRVAQTGAARRLDSILDELSACLTEQAAATLIARAATRHAHQLRRRLFEDHLSPITRIARAELGAHPDLIAFRMPRRSTPFELLAAHAHGIARAGAPHAGVFIEAGLPDDFLARLTAAASELVEAYLTRNSWRARACGATMGIATRLADGQRTVQMLDSFVRAATRERRELRDAWLRVRTIAAVSGGRRSISSASGDAPVRLLTAADTPVIEASDGHELLQHRPSLALPAGEAL